MHHPYRIIVLLLLAILLYGCFATPYILKPFSNSAASPPSSPSHPPSNSSSDTGPAPAARMNGTINDTHGAAIANASVLLLGEGFNYSATTDAHGQYSIRGIRAGNYTILIGKDGYSESRVTYLVQAYSSAEWSPSLQNLCDNYYYVNTSEGYNLTTGYDGILPTGSENFVFPYPAGSSYDISPAPDGYSSTIQLWNIGDNPMLNWTLRNDGASPIPFHALVTLSGTKTEGPFPNLGMDIPTAAQAKPQYLGRIYDPTWQQVTVDPADPAISALARQIKEDARSNDTWTVARAMFIWLKNNTTYRVNNNAGFYKYYTARQVLDAKQGQCAELSALYIAMLRAVGIPARPIAGYDMEYPDYDPVPHEWVEFYDGQWVPVEVSGSNDLSIDWMLRYDFGFVNTNKVQTFADDGTDASGRYDYLPIYLFSGSATPHSKFSFYKHYEFSRFNPMYIRTCQNGTISMVKEKN